MSHIINQINAEWRVERNQGAYEREIVYPKGSVINGIPIISDTYLEREMKKKELEALNNDTNY